MWLVCVRRLTTPPPFTNCNDAQLDDLEPFYPDRMASRILGMGDVVTLVEKAQKEVGGRAPRADGPELKRGKLHAGVCCLLYDQ